MPSSATICIFVVAFVLSVDSSSISWNAGIPSPIIIPIRNVTLAARVVKRGVALSVGSPPQNLAFLLHAFANNTFLYDVGDFCAEDRQPLQCEGYHGGEIDVGASSTWSQANDQKTWGGASVDVVSLNGNKFGTDLLSLNASTTLNGLPMAIMRAADLGANVLGLHINSTLLNALVDAKMLASRSWSVFWGLTGADSSSQMDGSLVLGGYDLAKTTGTNHTSSFSQAPGCSLLVTVTNIEMNFPNGTDFNVLGSSHGAALRMCVKPDYPIITIPEDIWNVFEGYAGGSYIGRSLGTNLWGQVFDAEGVYPGDLTFVLDTGLQIRIPNNQLVVPDILIGPAGTPTFDDNTREILVNSLQDINADDVPLLGRTFLTSAYLFVDVDHSQFTLWQANATREQNIIAVGPSATCIGNSCTATTSATPLEMPLATPPANDSPKIGTIVGAVIGGVTGLALMVMVALLFWRRRKRASQETISTGSEHTMMIYSHGGPKEDGIAEPPVHELPETIHNHDLGKGEVHEMEDSERRNHKPLLFRNYMSRGLWFSQGLSISRNFEATR